MIKGMVRQILEKLAERLRAMESMAGEKSLKLRELLGTITHPTIPGSGVTAL